MVPWLPMVGVTSLNQCLIRTQDYFKEDKVFINVFSSILDLDQDWDWDWDRDWD